MTGTDFNELEEEFEDYIKKDHITGVMNAAQISFEFYNAIQKIQLEQKNQWVKEMERYVKQRALRFAQSHAIQLNLFERK